MSLQDLFIKLAKPDGLGVSRLVYTEEFVGEYSKLVTNNGGGWSRMDAHNKLTKTYNFVSIKKNEVRFSIGIKLEERDGIVEDLKKDLSLKEKISSSSSNKIIAYKLVGYNEDSVNKRDIRGDIKEYYRNKPCVLTHTRTQVELDHKNGRYNDPRVNNTRTQKIEDFQPLTKHANDVKRNHCKTCKETGKRFDAKNLGFARSFIYGSEDYVDGPDGCRGCYWHDIREFRSHIDKNMDIEDL